MYGVDYFALSSLRAGFQAIHELAVRSLAQLTAASMEVFHKTAELLMVPSTEVSCADVSFEDFHLLPHSHQSLYT